MEKIKIVSEMIPNNDNYAILDSKYIRGGVHCFPTLEKAKAMKDDFKKAGTILYIEEENKYYRLLASGEFENLTEVNDFLKPEDIIAGDNIILNNNDGKITIGAIVGDLPDNQVFSEELLDVTVELPIVNITTTNNPSLMPKQTKCSR